MKITMHVARIQQPAPSMACTEASSSSSQSPLGCMNRLDQGSRQGQELGSCFACIGLEALGIAEEMEAHEDQRELGHGVLPLEYAGYGRGLEDHRPCIRLHSRMETS